MKKMIAILIVTLFLLTSLMTFSASSLKTLKLKEGTNLGGTIIASVGEASFPNFAIEGAKITASPGGYTAYTDDHGACSLSVPAGIYEVKCTADGYAPFRTKSCEIDEGKTELVSFFMVKSKSTTTIDPTLIKTKTKTISLFERLDMFPLLSRLLQT